MIAEDHGAGRGKVTTDAKQARTALEAPDRLLVAPCDSFGIFPLVGVARPIRRPEARSFRDDTLTGATWRLAARVALPGPPRHLKLQNNSLLARGQGLPTCVERYLRSGRP